MFIYNKKVFQMVSVINTAGRPLQLHRNDAVT